MDLIFFSPSPLSRPSCSCVRVFLCSSCRREYLGLQVTSAEICSNFLRPSLVRSRDTAAVICTECQNQPPSISHDIPSLCSVGGEVRGEISRDWHTHTKNQVLYISYRTRKIVIIDTKHEPASWRKVINFLLLLVLNWWNMAETVTTSRFTNRDQRIFYFSAVRILLFSAVTLQYRNCIFFPPPPPPPPPPLHLHLPLLTLPSLYPLIFDKNEFPLFPLSFPSVYSLIGIVDRMQTSPASSPSPHFFIYICEIARLQCNANIPRDDDAIWALRLRLRSSRRAGGAGGEATRAGAKA